jgi:hypothetical protein
MANNVCEQTQDGIRSLDALHSIPVHKLRAQAAATEALTVPESYPHFTPFVENKKQVRPACLHVHLLRFARSSV